MNCQSGIVPALSWWELSSQVDVNAAVLSKLGGVTQPFERGVVCYNRAVLFLSSPTSRMTPFLFHQSQAAGNTLHCFHLHHTKSNLQREMMLVRSDFRQLRQLNDKYINFSSHDVYPRANVAQVFTEGLWKQILSCVWTARETPGSPGSGWQMTCQLTASFNDLLWCLHFPFIFLCEWFSNADLWAPRCVC